MGTEDQAQDREYEFTTKDFKRVQAIIYAKAGINLHDGKQAMVYGRVVRRLRATKHESFGNYLDWLETKAGADEWQEFTNALTTNLTSFFRERHHFEELRNLVKANPAKRDWKIWCAAASTGEEPYSIAMTMKDSCTPGTQFKIWASDIDTQVLQTAAAGIYKSASLSNLSPEQLKAHFLKGTGKNAGYCRVKPELKNHISFFQLNLMSENWPMKEMFDVVFCRNVMIYFDAATQRAVLAKIHRKTQPNGILFIGHSENFSDSSHLFTLKGKTMYMKA